MRDVVVVRLRVPRTAPRGGPSCPPFHATFDLREVPGKVLDQVLEEEIAVVLGSGEVDEVSLCHHLPRTHHLEGDRLGDIVLCRKGRTVN